MKKLSKILPFVIVLFWLIMMLLLIRRIIVDKRTVIEGEVDLSSIVSEWEDRDDWYLIAYNDRVTGICENKIFRDNAGYKIETEISASLPISHFIANIRLSFKSTLGEKFELKDFNFAGDFAGVKMFLNGIVEYKKIRYTYSDGSKIDKGFIDINRDISLVDAIRPFVIKNLNLEKGKVYTIAVSNPIKDIFSSKIGLNKSVIELKILDDEKIIFQDKEVIATKVEFDSEGLKMYEWFDKEGNFLRGDLIPGLYIESTSEEYVNLKYPQFIGKIKRQMEPNND